jgi:hypothetical protein
MAAAAAVRMSCRINEAHSTQRRLGEKKRWKRLKRKEPRQKARREVPDLIQRVDSWGLARPRPK